MKIDTTAIEGFAEMTPEQQVKALLEAEIEEPKNDTQSLEKKVSEYKNAIDKLTKENAAQKRELNANKSAEELAKAEAEEKLNLATAQLEELRRENSITKHSAHFRNLGFTEEMARDSAEAMYEGNSEKVFANLEKFKVDFEKMVKAGITKNSPAPTAKGSGTQPKVTKEQFEKMGYLERNELYRTDPELYKQLKGE